MNEESAVRYEEYCRLLSCTPLDDIAHERIEVRDGCHEQMPVVDQRAKRSDGHDQDQRAAHDQAFRKQLHPRCRHDKRDEPKRIEDQRDHDGEHRRAQTAAPAHDAPDFLLRPHSCSSRKASLAQDIRGFALRHLQLKLIDFFMDVFKLKFIEIDRTPVLIRASIENATLR